VGLQESVNPKGGGKISRFLFRKLSVADEQQ
jgi:hypothetical protein